MIILLALISFLPVYSASSNLVYTIGSKTSTFGFLIKHLAHIAIGIIIIYFVHKIPYEKFRRLSFYLIPVVIALLLFALLKGKQIGGANASRWIQIPFAGITFQPSSFAFIVLMVFTARMMTKFKENSVTFSESIKRFWWVVAVFLGLILPSNFSTTAIMFVMVLMVAFIAKYPVKHMAYICGLAFTAGALFFLLGKAFPTSPVFNRINTWVSRVERFTQDNPDEDNYQIEIAKTAIASSGVTGLGPGKSVQKNFLPQSSSDFIYAIIVEELGLIGGILLLCIYMILFLRFIIRSTKAPTTFGRLLIIALGFPIIFQALTNMCVATELMPVTGQPLPLISSGGTSVWMTCIALGIILSVTKREDEVAQDLKEQQEREEALLRLIDREVALHKTTDLNEEKLESIKKSIRKSLEEDTEDSLFNGENPMELIKNK